MTTPVAARPVTSPPGQGQRLRSLDGLRTFSIALVLVGHALPYESRNVLGDLGNLGVRWFFVISGFLITRLLLKEADATGGISLSRFYVRRALRIFPAFYVYLLAIFLAQSSGLIEALTPRSWLHALTYSSNYQAVRTRSWYVAHLWSLAVEEQFYLLWPFVLALFGRRRGLLAVAFVVGAAPLLRAAIVLGAPGRIDGIPWRFETVCDALAVGCLLAGCRDWLWRRERYRRLLAPLAILALVVFVLLVNWLGFRYRRFGLLVGQALINVCIAICLDFCLRFHESLAGRVLNWRPIAFLGTLSYSIYLWQQPFFAPGPSLATRFPLNLALALAAAAASYAFVERPLLRLKDRVTRRA